jgi:hypothetical protein
LAKIAAHHVPRTVEEIMNSVSKIAGLFHRGN